MVSYHMRIRVELYIHLSPTSQALGTAYMMSVRGRTHGRPVHMQEVRKSCQFRSVRWKAFDRVLEPEKVRVVPRLSAWAQAVVLPRGTPQDPTILQKEISVWSLSKIRPDEQSKNCAKQCARVSPSSKGRSEERSSGEESTWSSLKYQVFFQEFL